MNRNEQLYVERLLDMINRVEWVRQSSGNKYVCPFCHCISIEHGGPDHADDCEWLAVWHSPYAVTTPVKKMKKVSR